MSRTVVDAADLERRVKDMYTRVALDPQGQFHFETGRAMARRLGYSDAELDAAPAESIESFAGVGYYFDLANLRLGEQVVDLGSGSGMDSFIAAHVVEFFRDYYGPTNRAFAALTAYDQEALHADLVALWRAHNQSSLANRTAVDAEYLQVMAIRSKQ